MEVSPSKGDWCRFDHMFILKQPLEHRNGQINEMEKHVKFII